MKFFSIFTLVTVIITLASCTKDVGPNPDLIPAKIVSCDTITFAKNIKPIIVSKCVSCHYPGGTGNGDYTTNTYAGIKLKVDAGSFKKRVIDGPAYMPASGRLPDVQIEMIKCWLDAGAPNN